VTQESIGLALLAKYFDGTASAEERERVVAWIGSDPERRAVVAELSAVWATDARRLEARYDTDAAWSRVAANLNITRRQSGPTRVVRTWHSPAITAWAAAVVVAVGLGAWWVAARRQAPATQSAPTERVYQTARAQRAMVRLSDGSEVTLNAESRLRVPPDFGPHKREVSLEGQGYFSVVHDTAAPFTVKTARGVTRDIGTRFSVRAYASDAKKLLEVVVAEGAVSIASASRAADSLVLHASEVGRVTEEGELRAEHNVDVRELLGWTEGRLEFKNVPLREALPVIGRWYDSELRVADSQLARYPITVTLTGERFGDAIEVIARAIGARVVKREGVVVLVRK